MLSKLQAPMAAEPKRSATKRRAAAQSKHEAAPQEEGTLPSPKVAAPPKDDFKIRGGGPGSTHSEPVGDQAKWKATGKGQMFTQPIPGQGWYTDGRQWWPVDPSMMMASWSSTPFSSWSFPSQQTQVNPMNYEDATGRQHGTRTKTQTRTKAEPEAEKPSKKDKDKEKKDNKDKKDKEGKKPTKDEPPPDDDPPDWGDGDDGDEHEDGSEYTYEEESEEEELQEPDQEVEVTPRSAVSLTPRSNRGGEPRQRPGAEPKRRPAARGVHHVGANPPRRRRQGGAPPGGSGPSSAASSRRSSTINTASVRDLLQQRGNRQEGRMRANLGQVKLETFSGDRSQYRNWMKTIQAQKQLYGIQDNELSVLMFLSTTGEAREVLNQLEVTDMQQEGGLQRILRLLEEAYGSKADERLEERQSAFLNYRRMPGQSIAAYLATLKRLRTEYLREDVGTVISVPCFCTEDVDKSCAHPQGAVRLLLCSRWHIPVCAHREGASVQVRPDTPG